MPRSIKQPNGKHRSEPTQDKSIKHGYILPSNITTYTRPPSNWPSDLPYLSMNQQSLQLTAFHGSLIAPRTLPVPTESSEPILSSSRLSTFSPTSNPLVQIKQITSTDHPAYQQYGLFAAQTLPPGSHIVDYTGLLHCCPLTSCKTSDYDLAFLDRDASLAIDSADMGNEGRFVNDYHGIREAGPNAVFEEYYVKVKDKGKDAWQARMGIWVKPADRNSSKSKTSGTAPSTGIAKGEEICVSYGKGWWRARQM